MGCSFGTNFLDFSASVVTIMMLKTANSMLKTANSGPGGGHSGRFDGALWVDRNQMKDTFRTLLLGAAYLSTIAGTGCSEPSKPLPEPLPPAIVGEDDQFAFGGLRPIYVDEANLYFSYTATDYFGDSLGKGPARGLYRVPVLGGEPSLVLEGKVTHGRREGDNLVVTAHAGDSAMLATIPLDGSDLTVQVLTDAQSVASVVSSGHTFVLSSDWADHGKMAITRLATAQEDEQSFAVREGVYLDEGAFYASGGYLYWSEREYWNPVRIADDLSQQEPEDLVCPTLNDVPIYGDTSEEKQTRLLGVISDEVFGLYLVKSFFKTGGTYDNGDPKGYTDFGGGAIFTVGADLSATRLVATDVTQAVIVGDAIFGQNKNGKMVSIDPTTGETTTLIGRSRRFDFFNVLVANNETLFFSDSCFADEAVDCAIRSVSLAKE